MFTIVVKNRKTGFGIPCAFFLTKDQKWEILRGWLIELKSKMDQLCNKEFQPTVVITDQGQNEINAIRAAFSFNVKIFYCAWHILQAWERRLTNNSLGSGRLEKTEKENRKRMVCSPIARPSLTFIKCSCIRSNPCSVF